ncbi:hypothetical protein CISIN_1g037249mg, partial [Citrus sinensis]
MLVGKVNPSLLDLNHLSYLGLSFNDFQGVQIPRFIGSIRNLRYLNLSDTQFVGMIPPPLGNLSNLQSLDLSLNYLYVENFLWLSGLSFLEQLDLCYVNLSKASDWLLVANTLPSLVELRLSNCQLHHLPPLTISNFSSLTVLDLSFSQFDNSLIPGWGPIPSWLYRLTHFEQLSVADRPRRIPRSMASLCNLRTIYLSGCVSKELEILVLQSSSISGHLTEQIGHFKNLDTLDLGNNSIVGLVPLSLNELSKLRILHLPDNKLNGTLFEIHFVNLTKLSVSSVNENNLTLKVNHDWVPPFQLVQLGLRSFYLDLFNNSFSGSISHFCYQNLMLLTLSNNKFTGNLPNSLGSLTSLVSLHLHKNIFSGTIPISLKNCTALMILDVGENEFVGNISTWFGERFSRVVVLILRSNQFRGLLPT